MNFHRVDRRAWGEAVYMAFITAITIGYGDMTPQRPLTRLTAILLGLVGVIFTGIIVSLAVYATSEALASASRHLTSDAMRPFVTRLSNPPRRLLTGASGCPAGIDSMRVEQLPQMVDEGDYPDPIRSGRGDDANPGGYSGHYPISVVIDEGD